MGTEPPDKQPPSAPESAEPKPAAEQPAPPAGEAKPSPPPAAAEKPAPPQGDKPAAPAGDKPAAPASPAAPAAAKPAAAAKPPAPPPKKEEKTPLESDLAKRFRARFGEAIREAWLDRKQAILVVDSGRLREICHYAHDDEEFDMLTDLTAVDWPRREKRFDLVLQLYSFPKNERLRIKAMAGDGEPVPSVTSIWAAANWLERECFDMFGIRFDGHPDLKRILLPEEWQGFPLRKDYDILQQDQAWVRENLGIESGQ
jgi:NADH-quinone oxidoreductase subunit C